MNILSCISFDSYIKPQRAESGCSCGQSCISFDSYIKPQLELLLLLVVFRCISFDSYIKPQLGLYPYSDGTVVYLLIPTSNHNQLP